MSNAKWKTLFAAVGKSDLDLRQVVVKFVGDNEERRMRIPNHLISGAFLDSIEFGPFPLVAIEWLEFPRTAIMPRGNDVPVGCYEQNTDAIRVALERTGKVFPLENTPSGLRIIGHVC